MRVTFGLVLVGLVGCTPEEEVVETGECGATSMDTWVVSKLTFARRVDGVVNGFDVDGHDSTFDGDSQGCNRADLVTPDGTPGIDNAFSGLVPVLESTEAVAAESLIAQSISAGELLITMEIGADNWMGDDCVDFTLARAGGVPLVSSDGSLLDDQTLSPLATVEPVSRAAVADDGRITVTGLEFNLPLDILNAELDFQVTRGSFWVQKRWDGKLTGVMGGVIPIAQIIEILERDDVNLDAFVGVVQAAADVRDDAGQCSLVSLGFELEATPAYLAHDSTTVDAGE